MHSRPVEGLPAPLLFLGRVRDAGLQNRIPYPWLNGEFFIGKQDRRPGAKHMPLDVISQHTKEDVGLYAILDAVADG